MWVSNVTATIIITPRLISQRGKLLMCGLWLFGISDCLAAAAANTSVEIAVIALVAPNFTITTLFYSKYRKSLIF